MSKDIIQLSNAEIENEKLKLEREKLQIEKEKLKVERFKAWWTGISILIPLLIVTITIAVTASIEQRRAKAEFNLKVLETLMSDPASVEGKVEFLKLAFPDSLDTDFGKAIPKGFSDDQWNRQLKTDFFHTYANSSRSSAELFEMWKLLHNNEKETIGQIGSRLFPKPTPNTN